MSEQCGGQRAADRAGDRAEEIVASLQREWRPLEIDELLFEDGHPALEQLSAEALQNPRGQS